MKLDQESPSKWCGKEQDKLVQPSIRNQAFLAAVEHLGLRMSWDADSRIFHGHGHTCHEMFKLRSGEPIGRVPDVVMWPQNHADVVTIVAAASEHGVGIIPYGGGTSVTGALQIPQTESRMVISLDMHDMCKIVHVDKVRENKTHDGRRLE